MLCPTILPIKVGWRQSTDLANGKGKKTGSGMLEYTSLESNWTLGEGAVCESCIIIENIKIKDRRQEEDAVRCTAFIFTKMGWEVIKYTICVVTVKHNYLLCL